MRWYLNTQKLSGRIELARKGHSELLLVNEHGDEFSIINTDSSRGLAHFCGETLTIEGRVKGASTGRSYLWVDRWFRGSLDGRGDNEVKTG
ncbi:MAG: hypothetical protein H6624_03130 [Bdellovibrionaceae bacterium]|nr:hypothetical protein [Bdellovibrionales bacterium]MCB9083307.1 hypothetical protein [Pseudobdellovibrionaceae bacterium]